MKKLIALTLSMALLVSSIMLMSVVPVSAAETLTIGTITNPITAGVYTFTVPFTASSGVEQVTLLATRGAGATAPTTIDNTTIVAIDQVALSAGQFVFSVDATKFDAVTYPNIYIKLGGTAIDTAVSNNAIVLAEAATTFKVVGYVDVPVAVGASAALADGTPVTTDATGKFEITGVSAGVYDLKIAAKSALMRTISVTVVDADVEVSLDTKKIDLIFGDINGSGKIDGTDITMLKNNFNKIPVTQDEMNADLNGSNKVDGTDITILKNNFNKQPSVYGTWNK